MTNETISLGDIGTDLRATITENGSAVDVSTVTAMVIELTKPDGTVVEKTATFVTDGSDGVIRYITDSDDIDQTGLWSYRAKVTFAPDQVFHSINPQSFTVI